MKDTGIIRRVDELGRLVIPKEIRKHLRIRDGDSVEIFINDQGQIVLKKHALFGGLEQSIDGLAKTLSEATHNTVLISDVSTIVAGGGKNAANYIGTELSNSFINLVEQRRPADILANEITGQGENFPAHVYPLIVHGDLYGAVIICEDSRQIIGSDIYLIQTMNKFLIRQLET